MSRRTSPFSIAWRGAGGSSRPRHPGFGATPRPQWFRTVHDIAYLYLDLLDRLALTDTLLVGASFGGWIALEIAVRSEARLGQLALIDSLGVKFGGREERDIADIYALPAEEVLRPQLCRTRAGGARLRQARRWRAHSPSPATARRPRSTAGGPTCTIPACAHWLHRITRPTLVLWGEEDRIVTPAYGEQLAAALPNARFELVQARRITRRSSSPNGSPPRSNALPRKID